MAENMTPSVGNTSSPQPAMPQGEPRLRMKGIGKSFGAVRAPGSVLKYASSRWKPDIEATMLFGNN